MLSITRLLIADRTHADPRTDALKNGRYSSFDDGDAKRFENGELDLAALRNIAACSSEPNQVSAKQELVENLINDHIVGG